MKTPTMFLCMAMIAASVAMAGCYGGSSEDTPDVTPSLTVTPASLSFDGAGGSATVTVTATEKWKVSSDADWISLSNTSGPASSGGYNVTVKADENGGEERSATVTFVLGENAKTATVAVSQAEKEVARDGSEEYPYMASEALALIKAGNNTADSVCVWGIVSQILDISTSYGNATYYISDDGTVDSQLEIYRSYYLGREKYTSSDQLALGDTVVVYGVLVNYNNTTPEMTTGGYLKVHKKTTRSSGDNWLSVAPKWMELPETSSDSYKLFARDMELGGVKARNYAFYWNYTDRVSMWVAYPLNAWLRLGGNSSGSGRSEAWGYDPLLPIADQQNVATGYNTDENGNALNGKYSRGHQIPSADRQYSYSVNATTYYGTNMTPQYSNFNSGIWATLEGQVRDWANDCDTLYVLTGCEVDGATHWVLDDSENQITVPTAYFKALLRYKASDAEPYSATSFWFNHESYITGAETSTYLTKDNAMTLDELEEKLGYGLFVNLDAEVGADKAAEIRSEANWW